MLKTLLIAAFLAQSAPETLSSGADLQAWRSIGPEASEKALTAFLSTYSYSPLAELAVRRLESQGASLPTADLANVLQSVLNHDVQLAQIPAKVSVATVTMTRLAPSERAMANNPPIADATDSAPRR
jgi:hypothetical protein